MKRVRSPIARVALLAVVVGGRCAVDPNGDNPAKRALDAIVAPLAREVEREEAERSRRANERLQASARFVEDFADGEPVVVVEVQPPDEDAEYGIAVVANAAGETTVANYEPAPATIPAVGERWHLGRGFDGPVLNSRVADE